MRFKTAERYETKNEWGTSYRAGLQVGSLGRKPVILTRTYKVARAKPETVMGVIGWLWGATTSPAQYKIEIGRIALPTFGLGARWANRLTDFPTTATFENYDNQNH